MAKIAVIYSFVMSNHGNLWLCIYETGVFLSDMLSPCLIYCVVLSFDL